jgi:FkbM family methyltransferase
VKAFNIAVSQAEGERVLHLAAEPVCNSLLMRTDVAMRGDITVKAWSLERVLRTVGSSVDLLKMDIEGLEYEVLLSCSPQALGVVERIALEYHDKAVSGTHDVSQLSAFLNRNGFSTQLNVTRRILLAQRK